jgi:AmmeMemoRadiSam system protein A
VSAAQRPAAAAVGRDLSAEERRTLLQVARDALEAHFARRPAGLPQPTSALAEKRGAFVTLHARASGDLRGCVGMMRSDQSLLATVARMAVAAATEDGRFESVTVDELPALQIEISALGPMRPIRPDEVEVGRHGLWISYAGRRGVLLPQVAVENGWDRETFLDRTCWKAGLPEDTWRKAGVELLGFTATVFAEHVVVPTP